METNHNGNNGLLSILTREGVLLKVSVHYWRGCKRLRPEDIGLERKNLSDQLISLGHKRLLPKDALATLAVIEGRAHALVEANTFPFLNGLGHFLPNSKLAEVTEKLKEMEETRPGKNDHPPRPQPTVNLNKRKTETMKLKTLLKRITSLPWLLVTATDGDKWIGTGEGDDRITNHHWRALSIVPMC
jgi:hypothetical protein